MDCPSGASTLPLKRPQAAEEAPEQTPAQPQQSLTSHRQDGNQALATAHNRNCTAVAQEITPTQKASDGSQTFTESLPTSGIGGPVTPRHHGNCPRPFKRSPPADVADCQKQGGSGETGNLNWKMSRVIAILMFLHGLTFCTGDQSKSNTTSKLILVSFDGFRADYLSKFSLPNLQEFMKEGVLVEEVKNVFITKTFPNHYSIVTGLYAESHGIVANQMYDSENNKTFNTSTYKDSFWWDQATPIWLTNQLQGRKSGSGMWPGTDLINHNFTPSYYLNYDPNVNFSERVNNLTNWFMKPDNPINFALLYWHEPDSSGHRYGPDDASNMSKVLSAVDENVGYLMSKLKEFKLWDTVNVIITSDHGMAECSKDKVIKLDDCISRDKYILVDSSTIGAVLPVGDPQDVYTKLKNCSTNMQVYLKKDIPDHYHYKHNSRIQPILLVADEGWFIVQNGSLKTLGNHGYDNRLPSMHPFLAARGPAFQKNYKISTINMVDIYPMMCHILGLKEMPNNGTLSNTKCLLVDQWCIHVPEAIGIVLGSLMVLTTLTCIIIMLRKKISSPRQFTRLEFQDDDDPLIG
ncbi:bis(5 -adenosyl)-triphosphatase ENPP4 [Pelobates cultripes]|uniref:bis(5'-adenosyl)-triphosphatase n=1 Tax=Pelobates cultripes TaxID=61616 RepID=A0AAD1R9S5_PELCU|nr:bis(5 -adenosyl)-triphosphatase ENPP4 [Pelobates cultripes]